MAVGTKSKANFTGIPCEVRLLVYREMLQKLAFPFSSKTDMYQFLAVSRQTRAEFIHSLRQLTTVHLRLRHSKDVVDFFHWISDTSHQHRLRVGELVISGWLDYGHLGTSTVFTWASTVYKIGARQYVAIHPFSGSLLEGQSRVWVYRQELVHNLGFTRWLKRFSPPPDGDKLYPARLQQPPAEGFTTHMMREFVLRVAELTDFANVDYKALRNLADDRVPHGFYFASKQLFLEPPGVREMSMAECRSINFPRGERVRFWHRAAPELNLTQRH